MFGEGKSPQKGLRLSTRPRDGRLVDRLTDLDLVMLGASKTWPQDIGALAIFDGSSLLDSAGLLRMGTIKDAIGARLHLVPRLRQIIHTPRRGLGDPLWIDAPDFDLAQHMKQQRLASPGRDRELTRTIEQLRFQPLDPSRPMWEMCFLTGLTGQRVGLYIRLHHTIADGMAAMVSVTALLDTTPDTAVTSIPQWTPSPPPSEGDLRADFNRRRIANLGGWMARLAHPSATLTKMAQAWPGLRELLAEEPATKTSLDRMVGAARDLALIRTSLDQVKETAHEHGASVNDVLLTATAGGLRALLSARGEPVEDTTVRIFVPVSLRHGLSGPQQGNLIAQMVVPLRLAEPDPIRRLDEISAETKRRKAMVRTSLGGLMHGRVVRRLALSLVMRQRVNVTSSSIPGPPTPLYLAGARLLEVFPVLPLIANQPLGIGALSYAGGLYIGIVVDGEAFHDLDVFAQAAREDLQALTQPASPSAELVSRSATQDERTTR